MELTYIILTSLIISMSFQTLFFIFATYFKTDKVTDLSYGLTFILLAAYLFVQNSSKELPQIIIIAMITVWGLRLATHLLYRIIMIKQDPRFDGVRESFWKFAKFWTLQGIAVWLIMLPVIIWFSIPIKFNYISIIGIIIWITGLILETTADIQKFKQKSDNNRKDKWLSTGVWKYSRYPNYLGELLCWWGIFIFVLPSLSGWLWFGIIGPITITILLLLVTGIPLLEKSREDRYGKDPEYQKYKKNTGLLIPKFIK